MFDAIQQFFDRMMSDDDQRRSQISVELASAAILCEVMRADQTVAPEEIEVMKAALVRQFDLSTVDVDELMTLARQETDAAVDHYQFVRLLNDQLPQEDRFHLLCAMWQIAWADGELAPLEEARIRKLADLLFLSHSDFIRAKVQVQSQRDAEG